jgi:2-polyprenyl-3-methyl-5-hydroxy-6-metoxy-1,4-benzoquinol methylase
MISFIMKEKQYDSMQILRDTHGRFQLGLISNAVWHDDPKSLLFKLARYKFVSQMLKDSDSVLEVGSGDGFCSRIVSFSVKKLTLSDFDSEFIREIEANGNQANSRLVVFNPILEHLEEKFDAIFSLDVIEHIDLRDEVIFIMNLKKSLKSNGIVIFGTPSLESQVYASERSKLGHINCKSADDWKLLFKRHFRHVFQFGMNDEVIHTGFGKMSHYLFFICIE